MGIEELPHMTVNLSCTVLTFNYSHLKTCIINSITFGYIARHFLHRVL